MRVYETALDHCVLPEMFIPLTGEEVVARRRRIKVDYELPMKDQYGEFILRLIEESLEGE
jgi:hypothetical protein